MEANKEGNAETKLKIHEFSYVFNGIQCFKDTFFTLVKDDKKHHLGV